MTTTPARVLVVCTGNICRSPAAAALLRAQLSSYGIDVGSAGTAAVVGAPMTPQMRRLVEEAGADAEHAAVQLRRPAVAAADLVLTGTAEHRGYAVRLAPGAVRRSFTLREFARLIADAEVDQRLTPAERVAALAAHAQSHRRASGGDDIADPFGGTQGGYDQTFAAIRGAVGVIADRVVGGRVPRVSPRRAPATD
ncbi:low molecular weight phosphatase family protein [Flexivirga meconopsidis]|uniref:arsenate reductase/protein-tyrosine-phosphatase family protein n=1 Tax=Flexivirga meconopsidis TaxID=2977121 RepID=UPI00223EEF86|nr:low molecular weight phosphatase family protein [Flexivirga meconopsidis]